MSLPVPCQGSFLQHSQTAQAKPQFLTTLWLAESDFFIAPVRKSFWALERCQSTCRDFGLGCPETGLLRFTFSSFPQVFISRLLFCGLRSARRTRAIACRLTTLEQEFARVTARGHVGLRFQRLVEIEGSVDKWFHRACRNERHHMCFNFLKASRFF